MRQSFDGLSMMAEHIIRCNPFSGHLFVFCNRRSDRVKILHWDRGGWAIWYNRPREEFLPARGGQVVTSSSTQAPT